MNEASVRLMDIQEPHLKHDDHFVPGTALVVMMMALTTFLSRRTLNGPVVMKLLDWLARLTVGPLC
jgi:hypothetical protein